MSSATANFENTPSFGDYVDSIAKDENNVMKPGMVIIIISL